MKATFVVLVVREEAEARLYKLRSAVAGRFRAYARDVDSWLRAGFSSWRVEFTELQFTNHVCRLLTKLLIVSKKRSAH